MLRRSLLIAAVLLFLFTGTAAAQDAYPPTGGVANVDVASAGAGGAQALPTTGASSTIPMVQVGMAVMAVGGFLVLVAARRRSPEAALDRTPPGA